MELTKNEVQTETRHGVALYGWAEQSFGRLDGYPCGPWDGEPDKVQWVDAETGLDCLIVRQGDGALRGYVGVPPQHPWHGVDYNGCLLGEACELPEDESHWEHSPEQAVNVHGGLTYADACNEDNPEHVCHVPLPGRAADVWWFGFATAHYDDLTPSDVLLGDELRTYFGSGTYKDLAYVVAECHELALQLADVAR